MISERTDFESPQVYWGPRRAYDAEAAGLGLHVARFDLTEPDGVEKSRRRRRVLLDAGTADFESISLPGLNLVIPLSRPKVIVGLPRVTVKA